VNRVLVTGASGFVGGHLCSEIQKRGLHVVGVVRKKCQMPFGVESVCIGLLNGETDWGSSLANVDVIIHLAARVHVMKESVSEPLAEFRKVNCEGTERLARCAAAAGVKRLIYVSSIKVNGEETCDGERVSELSMPLPLDTYGVSKWEAEQVLHQVEVETGLEIVIVRPPLVYGAGVKGNFAQMLKVLAKRWPLPFASIENKRSLVYVGNLVDALIVCATHPAAAGQTYLISDGEDVSTPDLLRNLGGAMGCPARLFPFPPKLLTGTAATIGRAVQMKRLTGSLQIDSGKICRELNWTPPYTLQQGLQETAEWYRDKYL